MNTLIILPLLFLYQAADAYRVPRDLLVSLCRVESNLKPKAKNGKAIGLCQVKLTTAQMLKFKITEKELYDPRTNSLVASHYLSRLLRRYNSITLAVAAYNTGHPQYNGDTLVNQAYVDKVIRGLNEASR